MLVWFAANNIHRVVRPWCVGNIPSFIATRVFKLPAAHFSENWGIISVFPVLGGNIFSIVFGCNLDAHEPSASLIPSPSITSTRCLAGRECYVQTLYLNIWACVIALCLSFWAGRRDWEHWNGQDQRVERINAIEEWEDTGEAVVPED